MKKADTAIPILRVTTDFTEVAEEAQRSSKSLSVSSRNSSGQKKHLLSKRNPPVHPVFGCSPCHGKNPYIAGTCTSNISACKSNVSSFTQRVMSAKFLKVKQLQNELAEVQGKLTEALNENRVLRTLQKRQDVVLKKFQGTQEQLPQLLNNHSEEIRVLRIRFKQVKDLNKEFENRLKQRDSELLRLRAAHSRLVKLAKDKKLFESEKLSKKVEEMEHTLSENRKEIVNLSKKLEIEAKAHKQQLHTEVTRHKETQKELAAANKTIEALKSEREVPESEGPRNVPFMKKRFPVSFSSNSMPGAVPSLQTLSVPTPPRVSIRQLTPTGSSVAAPIQEEPDSPTESLSTVNYSQIAGDSSSEEVSVSGPADEDNEHVTSMKVSEWRKNYTTRRTLGEVEMDSTNIMKQQGQDSIHSTELESKKVNLSMKVAKVKADVLTDKESESDIDEETLKNEIDHMKHEMASLQLKLKTDRESEIDSMVNRVYESLVGNTLENGNVFASGDAKLKKGYTDFDHDLDFSDSLLAKSKHSGMGDFDVKLEENKKADLLRALDRIDKEKVFGESALETPANPVSFFPVV